MCVKVLIATAKDLKNVYQWEELWVWPAACYVAKQALARAVLYMMLPSTDENNMCPYSFNANKNSECKYWELQWKVTVQLLQNSTRFTPNLVEITLGIEVF